ncbi:reverse transcriptase (RNA-dependent DNA polymerase) [Halanaerobium saccharolyticum]|uniref:Reverse transcriptase (RNA-dependent DNA polymerase) n=1 Tax=Halanaerobium saccharolyticum TaxID=43595 RepID=A0A4R6LYY9_9FIRM|nr:RNA-directed DNA polymerase [Halanaerobium saccharolyticum]TDO94101.1 reverse transcriptase (RNA-dependent DNA polymerase) [Halanaerobium saccharolyticum]
MDIDEPVEQAYKKLKSYIYYDNTLNILRHKISEFETGEDFEKKLGKVSKILNDLDSVEDFAKIIEEYQIDKTIMPKGISLEDELHSEDEEKFITNDFEASGYKAERTKYLVDADIEIHIIAVLWVMKVGYKLENNFSNNSYGYKLELSKENNNQIAKGLKLFKPYFYQYQDWRDNALDAAQALTKRGKDTAIIGLDIKGYFNNVELSFDKLRQEIKNEFGVNDDSNEIMLTNLLEEIYKEYAKSIGKENFEGKGLPLPIGLLSSSVLANWYLKEFDQAVVEEVNPSYYGRYVDDILIVISNPIIDQNKSSQKTALEKIIEKYLCDNNILNKSDKLKENQDAENKSDDDQNKEAESENKEKKSEYQITVQNEVGELVYDNLAIQNKKINVYYLKADGSQAILENFKENIRRNSSEFRFLPENHKIENEFKFEAHSMLYDDSVNKLNSIKAFRHNKYKASVYLSKKIYASRLWDKDSKDAKNTAEQIMKFFKGKICLEFHILWEKIFAYFILKEMKSEFVEFYSYVIKLIDKLSFEGDNTQEKKLKEDLERHLEIAAAIPLSLNPEFLDKEVKNNLVKKLKSVEADISDENIKLSDIAENIREANLMRHNLVFTPLLNYTNLARESESYINLTEKNLHKYYDNNFKDEKSEDIEEQLEFDPKLNEYSPRFIKFNEFNNYFIFKNLFFGNKTEGEDVLDNYLEESYGEFKEINDELGISIKDQDKYFELKINGEKVSNVKNKAKKVKAKKAPSSTKKFKIKELKVSDDESREKLNIGVANIKLSENDFKKSYRKNYNLSAARKEKLFRILNLSYTEKVNGNELDIIILPEVSVPPAWLSLLADYSRRHQKAIVCGLEHFISNNDTAYNLIVTILPFMVDDYKYSLVKARIKNHYSPAEKEQLTGNHLELPEQNFWHYDKFIWRDVHFACYNCYELTDIVHRSIFKSEVDLLIASVYNRDVNYFSNIVESVSRDVHCYFIQVNSSNYGDTRVTQPSKTEVKDIMRFKGGENPAILATSIDIIKLRNFQFVKYNLQKASENNLKNTPPDFNKEKVKERMRDFRYD